MEKVSGPALGMSYTSTFSLHSLAESSGQAISEAEEIHEVIKSSCYLITVAVQFAAF